MIEYFLSAIKNPDEYLKALSILTYDKPISLEDADAFLTLYRKYLPNIKEMDFLRVSLAVDMLQDKTSENISDLKAIGLTDKTLNALLYCKLTIISETRFSEELFTNTLAIVNSRDIPLVVRVMCCRAALNRLQQSTNIWFSSIKELAKFIQDQTPEVVERGLTLLYHLQSHCNI